MYPSSFSLSHVLTLFFASTLTTLASTQPLTSPFPNTFGLSSPNSPFTSLTDGPLALGPNEFNYTVPSTPIRLEGSYSQTDGWRVPPPQTNSAINSIRQTMKAHISSRGDGPLAQDPISVVIQTPADPQYEIHFSIVISSWHGGKLTYQNVIDTLDGIEYVLAIESHYQALQAEIVVGDQKMVGYLEFDPMGSVVASRGVSNNVTAGAQGNGAGNAVSVSLGPNEFDYTVPATNVRLEGSYNPDPNWRLPPSQTNSALNSLRGHVINHIIDHGDGPIIHPHTALIGRTADPQFPYKFDIKIAPWDGGVLTYGNVRDAIEGIEYILARESQYHAAQGEIVVGNRGVGYFVFTLLGPWSAVGNVTSATSTE